MNKYKSVKELPENISNTESFEINTNEVNYFTHGFFKYPCKFIPQIPRWAILKYTEPGEYVLDPFAGSGTSLVEAVLHGRKALGVDFDKLSNLLTKTKTKSLSKNQIKKVHNFLNTLQLKGELDEDLLPNLRNLYHWFPEENVRDLTKLKGAIEKHYQKGKDKDVYNFLLTCFASTIRKVSRADDASPKPYVSTRIKKVPKKVKKTFINTCIGYLKHLEKYKENKLGNYKLIGKDARNISSKMHSGKIKLSITSPPYINAFDYVRSLKLENAWLGFYDDDNFVEQKKKQIGTEQIYSETYSRDPVKSKIKSLDKLVDKVYKRDKKRGHVISKYFEDMEMNLQSVYNILDRDGHYVLVVGNSKIVGTDIPTNKIIAELAERNGYRINLMFSYIIKNRYLRIPRSGRGGFIKHDWVLDLEKDGKNR